ncbi:helix-turn-helix domain-containing protein [Clostridium beijerinckii]|uniref:Helix-turn-helix transcriptional regulator n=1 Tax=Clostridium beijerinckii TaxID=1520 RepID=A0AAW3WDL3_CLOBE|nr:helix-turn-helix transcriptional regulator [Clostridium beijerinckii]MBC2459387.1 helix-turn-helix transcriptional regulator [Clostridium beijerinckii]MBC2476917.1 helix-turn-helix transcriptional regulator [Clostridium beijerinckii]NOV62721.1 transcriptional regulator with XRE-family HTH domain [Clostridium beijerinckii]NOV70317.1 transcriptional regulator with XRE-family HTH domain [Clostridium beijerinckii]NOW30775.1 transcriptional regulator with XRE-family HTH domain [Clostridium beije
MTNSENNNLLGEKIKELRTKKGWSLDELSSNSGVAKTTIWGIENGSKPSYDKLEKIADALGIQLAYLLNYDMYDGHDTILEKRNKSLIFPKEESNTSKVFNSYFGQIKNPKRFILKNSFSVDVDSLTDNQIDELFMSIDFAIKLKLEEFKNN